MTCETSKDSLSMCTRFALAAGRAAAATSRVLGRGSGGMIGGVVALKINPQVLSEVSAPISCAIVSGTNGKSTTTRMLASALSTKGEVASNTNGDNLTSGVVTALMNAPRSRFASLEVDEMHVPIVAKEVKPEALVLLNLSRDQLDRVGEIGAVELRLREAVEAHPQAIVVANCDDPLIVCAAAGAANVVWVSAGASWGADSVAYPRGGRVVRDEDSWHLVSTDEDEVLPQLSSRPEPQWYLTDVDLSPQDGYKGPSATLCGPDGVRLKLRLNVPGRANLGNAAQAVAAAVGLGVDPRDAVEAVSEVSEVAGRYSVRDIDGRLARMILAKNPAGWQETLTMVDPQVNQIVIGVNGQVPDGQDLSWLWDVDFSALKRDATPQPCIIACGERGADLAVRLEYANIHCELVQTPLEALSRMLPGRVELLLNYTALRDFLIVLDAKEKSK